ncbi:MAG: hydrogenase maturation nickel metallochaperone HypA [Paludibaculum sp.]
MRRASLMHELSITESILEIALRHAGGRRVSSVHLVIGELSSFVDESIQLYWQELTRGTLAEEAVLQFAREPGELLCLDCGRQFPVRTQDFLCPGCGSGSAVPARGKDCYVDSIEVLA